MNRILLLCLATTACGLDGLRDDDPNTRPDAGVTLQPWRAPACAKPVVRNTTFTLSSGGRVQIAPALAFDGRLHAAWSQAPEDEDQTGFDVFSRVFDCDGTAVSADVQLSATPDSNDTSARVVAGPNGALVAWTASLPTKPGLAVRLRPLDGNGAPKTAELSIAVDDTSEAWMPDLAMLPSGRFGVVSAQSSEEGPFRATFHELDPMGGLVAGPFVAPPTGLGHANPALAATAHGTHLVWAREDGEADRVVETALLGTIGAGDASTVSAGRTGDWPRASGWPTKGGRAWVVFGTKIENVFSIILEELGGELRAELGVTGVVNVAPSVAASSDGGAVAWIVQIPGGRALVVQRFHVGATGLDLSERVTVPTTSLDMQPLAIAHLEGDDFAIAWTEGTHPDLVVKARIVALQ